MHLTRTQVLFVSFSLLALYALLLMSSSGNDAGNGAGSAGGDNPRLGTAIAPARHVHPAGAGGSHGGLLTTAPFEYLVGMRAIDTRSGDEVPANREGEGQTWVDINQLVSARRAGTTRILRPGGMATMDYRPERLNIHLDDDGKVARLAMG